MSVTTKAWCGDCRATQVFERTGGDESICTVCGGGWVDLVTFEVSAPAVVRIVA
jgi:hypothetical protein